MIRRRQSVACRVVVATLTVGLALVAPGAAGAHARLLSTTPANGASLESAPAQLVLRFSDAVEVVSETIRVLDAEGAPVALGTVEQTSETQVVAEPAGPLPAGTYVVAWRAISADSHPLRGVFVFAVGEPIGAVGAIVKEELAAESSPIGLDAVQAVARFCALALVLLCLGAPVLVLAGGHGAYVVRTAWRLTVGAALGLALATLVWMTATGAEALGLGLGGLVELESIREVVGTSFGQVWVARISLALALAWLAALALEGLASRRAALGSGVVGAGLALSFPLAGHARVEGILAIASDATHIGAAGVWVGGLGVLAVSLVTAGSERTSVLECSVVPFSTLALGAVVVLLGTGILNALLELPDLSALWQSTYGQLVLAKSGLLAGLVGLGAVHRRVTLPRLRRGGADGPGLFLRVVALELVVMVAVICVTAALVAEPPRASQALRVTSS